MASVNPDIETRTIPIVTHCILPVIIVLFVASTRQNAFVRLATWLGYVGVALNARYPYTTGGGPLMDFSLGSFFGTHCFSTWWLLFYTDVETIRHRDDKVPLMERPLLSRMYWLSCLWLGQRGIGWNIESGNTPPKPEGSRTRFLARRAMQIGRLFLIGDIFHLYRYNNPVFGLRGEGPYSLGAQGPIFRVLNVLAHGVGMCCTISTQYLATSMLIVALGLSEPCSWPDVFGTWSDAYTVRRFWGRVWHQILRRVASSPGIFAARHLGFTKGSWLSSRTQLIVGFAITGMIHVFGDWMLETKGGSSFPFFFVQAFAIIFEDAIIDIAQMIHPKIGDARWTRVVGYLWTIAWFSWTTVWAADWQAQAGMGESQGTPFSVVAPVMKLVGIDVYDFQHLYPPVVPSASS